MPVTDPTIIPADEKIGVSRSRINANFEVLRSRLAAVESSVTVAISPFDPTALISTDVSLSSAISTEVGNRSTADVSLSSAVSTANSVRSSADVSLSSAVSTANSVRSSVDVSLSSAISTTVSVRDSADTSLATACATKLTSNTEIAALASALSGGTGYPHRTGPATYVMDTPAGGGGGLDADLTAIAALTGTGYAHRTAADTWVLDTPSGSGAPAQTDAAIDAGTDTEQRTASAAQLKRAALRWVHDPRIISLKEDFQRYIDPTTWYDYSYSGTGAAIAYPSSTVYSGHHGIVTCDTGATATGYAGVIGGNQFNYSVYPIIDKASVSYAEWNVILRTPATLSDGTDRYSLNTGAISIGELNSNTGFGLYYKDDVNSGKWLACSRQSSSTTADTGVTVAAATWYNVRITWDGTTLTFFLNGTSVATITTNIPTYFIGPGALVLKSVGTTTRQMVVDYISFYAETNTR